MNSRTKIRIVEGGRFDGNRWTQTPVVVRVTKDLKGKSLSLNVDDTMILIPIEPVEDMIDVPSNEISRLRRQRQLDMAEIVLLRRKLSEYMEREEQGK